MPKKKLVAEAKPQVDASINLVVEGKTRSKASNKPTVTIKAKPKAASDQPVGAEFKPKKNKNVKIKATKIKKIATQAKASLTEFAAPDISDSETDSEKENTVGVSLEVERVSSHSIFYHSDPEDDVEQEEKERILDPEKSDEDRMPSTGTFFSQISPSKSNLFSPPPRSELADERTRYEQSF